MKRFSVLCVLLLAVVGAPATHVNISISQQQAKSSAHSASTPIIADHSKLKSESGEVFSSEGRSARIQIENKDESKSHFANHRTDGSEIGGHSNHRSFVQSGHYVAEPEFQFKGMYQSSPIEYQRNAQFRRMDEQQKQNMEFERYIQNFHSGPTVETVGFGNERNRNIFFFNLCFEFPRYSNRRMPCPPPMPPHRVLVARDLKCSAVVKLSSLNVR